MLVIVLVAIIFIGTIIIVDAFPTGIIISFTGVMLLLIVATGVLLARKTKAIRIIGIVLAAFFIVVYGTGAYYMGTTYAMLARISGDSRETEPFAKSVNTAEDSFNIYITGIDQWDSEKGEDLERSDVNMIVTVCPKTRKILLTSIPRDTYVPLHTAKNMDKLTHTGIYGVDETLSTVEDWIGYDMNYFLKANFSATVDVINAMGGVEVYSPKEFKPVKRSWWTVKKGWNHMNGKEALAFARERKAFNDEDSVRVENQQRVVEAVLKKLMSSYTLLTKYGDIIEAAGKSFETNMPTSDMKDLIKMQLVDLFPWSIETQKIEGKYEMDYVASLTQESKFLVYKVDQKAVDKAKENIDKVMNPSSVAIAEATAQRQKNSMISFLKNLFKKEDSQE
ncbi:MAG: LCP family protein [Clostridiales bacterium]|nr:LCP family protein [Clostridiales bacterium]